MERTEGGLPGKFAAVVTILCLPMIAGCGGEEPEREYAVPRTLCGTAVERNDLAEFLPAGKEISVTLHSGVDWQRCNVVVDKTSVVNVTQSWLEKGRTTAYYARGQTLDDPTESTQGGRFLYSGYEAFGKTKKCVDKKYGQELYTSVQAQGSKHRDAEAMKRLIIAYTNEVEKSAACDTPPQ
ncbi:hypothetical protein [Streptomyces heilongjiangensis]|uniref:Lipoprotein n=1 Tax=Streptomyces heilongjiangensis TaxID=945052 RepID=A0ABW1B2F7_9ACTN|nr:hypothetical protein [Streptomyces heilongjiangensis]MDC2951309.1 hypothetical protein [Streptomyces heilongjiangensis]